MIGGALGAFESRDIERIFDILNDAKLNYQKAQDEMTYCDRRQQDLLHEIELVTHGRREIANIGIELAEIRRRRRVAKNTIELLAPVAKWRQEQAGPLTKLSNVIGSMRKIEERQQNQVYFKKTGDDAGEIIEHREG